MSVPGSARSSAREQRQRQPRGRRRAGALDGRRRAEVFRRLTERPADLLRFATAGSVDDGKSTLIGRLLYDSKQVLTDQLAHVEQASERMGHDFLDLSLLTDGLRAEREQGITIDVAYRYFATAQRRFIIADTPGPRAVHAQHGHGRLDGRPGDRARRRAQGRASRSPSATPSSARCSAIPHVVVCVNKMDLVDFDEDVFDAIVEEFDRFAARLEMPDVTFIPISALLGDNVVERSRGDALVPGPAAALPPRARAHRLRPQPDRRALPGAVGDPPAGRASVADYRAYAGQVAGGVHAPGRRRRRAARRPAHDDRRRSTRSTGRVEEAFPPMSVAVRLADDIDVGRGSTIVRTHNQPTVANRFEALLCWMSEQPLDRAPALPRQAHDAHGDGRRRRRALPHRRRDACTATRARRRSQLNDLARVHLRAERAARVRLLPAQPRDGQPDRDRRGDQRNGRRRRDPRHRGRGARSRAEDASAARTCAGRARA